MLEELKKKLRAYEDAKSDWARSSEPYNNYTGQEIQESYERRRDAYNDLHDFIFQGNITSEDIG